MTTIIQERLEKITHLAEGAHSKSDGAMCAMEVVAWITDEPWSDRPDCVCPVISAFMRSWNDSLPDDRRTEILLPLITKTVGTRGSDALANRRATMATDWLVRVHTPAWLRLAGLTDHAKTLSSLPEIVDFAKTPSIKPVLEAARKDAAAAWAAGVAAGVAAGDAAWAAARDAAGVAAGDAAWAAARDAAGVAAGDAAGAAGVAAGAAGVAAGAAAGVAAGVAGVAAGAAAWDAARVAAWVAAGGKLAPTVAELQASAVDLVKRMCALEDA